MERKVNGVYIFILGIIFTGIDFVINTGVSYGFEFGVNEGVSKGMNTYFLEALIGDRFRVDVLFNPLGYLFILLGLAFMHGSRKYMMNMRMAAALGCVVSVIRIVLPFVLSQYDILVPVLILTGAEVLLMIVILYSFTLACKKQVDNFNDMEVGKDLTFATELYGFATVIRYIILPFAALYIYFARGAYLLAVVFSWGAILYFAFKTLKYTKKLHLFEENGDNTGER